MLCELYNEGKHLVRVTYNLDSFCSTATDFSTWLSSPDGGVDIFYCLKDTVSSSAEAVASLAKVCLPIAEDMPETLRNLASEPSCPVPVESLVTPGLIVGGTALMGVTAAVAYMYREQIRTGVSSAYNAATAYFGSVASAIPAVALPTAVNTLKKQLETKIAALDEISASLEKYTLGGIEKKKLAEAIDATRTTLEEMKAKGAIDAEALKARVEEVHTMLNKVSFEGNGVQKEDKDVSYVQRAMICTAQVLRSILSFLGQFMVSEECNPVAKLLLGRSFFVTISTTAREAKEIEDAKVGLLDSMLSATALGA